MLIISLKPINEATIKTDKVIKARLEGDLSVHTSHSDICYLDEVKKLDTNIITSYSYEDLAKLGEILSKVQNLIEFYQTRDDTIFCKYLRDKSFIKESLTSEDISNIVSGRHISSKQYRARVYAFLFELTEDDCLTIIKDYNNNNLKKKENPTTLSKIGINNLAELIFSGLNPDEIKILYNLSNEECERFKKTMYVEKEDFYKLIPFNYNEWYKNFVENAAEVNAAIQAKINGTSSNINFIFPDMDYLSAQDALVKETDMNLNGRMAAEITTKILLYKTLLNNISDNKIVETIKNIISKNHTWTDDELKLINESGQTKEEYIKTLKSAIRKGNEDEFKLLKSQIVAKICDINSNSVSFINDLFINNIPLEKCEGYDESAAHKEFKEILYILGLMRTNVKTECIEHIAILDQETSSVIQKLYRSRIASK